MDKKSVYEKQKKKQKEYFKRHLARQKAKRDKTLRAAISKVKQVSRQDVWCSTHGNCFRATIGKGESEEHIRKKFDRWLHWRKFGATVFCEMILKKGQRPDLIVCLNNGEVFIEEVAESESEESLSEKQETYPFPVKIVRCE